MSQRVDEEALVGFLLGSFDPPGGTHYFGSGGALDCFPH